MRANGTATEGDADAGNNAVADAAADDDADADAAPSVSYRAHTLENVSPQFGGSSEDADRSSWRVSFVIHFMMR